jgi:hypothetical protein
MYARSPLGRLPEDILQHVPLSQPMNMSQGRNILPRYRTSSFPAVTTNDLLLELHKCVGFLRLIHG